MEDPEVDLERTHTIKLVLDLVRVLLREYPELADRVEEVLLAQINREY
jgi:hypothetical protein